MRGRQVIRCRLGFMRRRLVGRSRVALIVAVRHASRLPQFSLDVRISPMQASVEIGELAPTPITPVAFGRPPRGRSRYWIAYVATLRVVLSYLSLTVQAKFRSPAAIDALARKKNLRNARRIHRAIARLQGLFIKVGQLISIMTNFLPEEFRNELAGLQDQVPPRPYDDVERRVREELGKGPRELFAQF